MRQKSLLVIGLVLLVYLLTHFINLTGLPVFADEAIYIRWAQLILEDPGRYAFFPLNDGKTPLFIWLLTPFQQFFSDPLFAGRTVAALVGLLQLGVVGLLLRELKVRATILYFGMLITALLPFWYIHHRLALMDGLLTLGISVAFWGVLRSMCEGSAVRENVWNIIIIAIGLGVALWSKIPAVLAVPSFYLPIVFLLRPKRSRYISQAVSITIGIMGGFLLFYLLRFAPAFSQLFSRGSDFLYPLTQVVFAGVWQDTLINIPSYMHYFLQYLTPSFVLLLLIGLFVPAEKKKTHLLFWSGVLFCAPIVLLGKVVYPRYLFPATLFFTLAGVVALEGIFKSWIDEADVTQPLSGKRMAIVVGTGLICANVVISSLDFIGRHLLHPNSTPFVMADREQYLTKWSSGHGIAEVAQLMRQESENATLAVATEGYFGTLPDGLLMYFFSQDVSNLYIEGVGQPVEKLPAAFINRASEFDQVWLVVNSHRLRLNLPAEQLVTEFCRPFNAPCLQVWDITESVATDT